MENRERIREILIEQGSIGRENGKKISRYIDLTADDGVTRPAGTDPDKKTRDYFTELCRKNGFDPFVDVFGNIFVTLQGTDPGIIMMGSHLDSVVHGGMFDGAMGVFSSLEVLLRLKESGYKNKKTLVVAAFTGEEGSAFHQPMLGSNGFTGNISREKLWAIKNRDGVDFKSAMQRIEYLGDSEFPGKPEYYLEYHIEQGPVLEEKKKQIGIVTSITGQCVLSVEINGIQGHSGTTPMEMRSDALVRAAEIIELVDRTAREASAKYKNHSVGTVGELSVDPGRFNVIPGHVSMKIDLRSEHSNSLAYMKKNVISELETTNNGINIKYTIVAEVEPSIMSTEVMDAIRSSVKSLGFSYMDMPSGAGHDTIPISKISKAGMIFVPSIKGLSHAPLEWTDFEDVERGLEVLEGAVKNLDKK
ncbi:MAG: M20 family metallo-hydrolase [Ferroplasma sp.]|uniref:M20 family metallo-hydrolase n=1 Tax=Ferroplasma sp. TaxID=2591003 RepID=UPI002815A8E1|nr:M20 family metallo-hydrolase [Ferroplasma sp.]WMT51079.1 MAG: M20 family metallo-hydrolase [Ferroplasma sp.]